jgi:hypothetical protein
MTAFEKQLEAIGSALLRIPNLPDGSVWSLTCTNDDDAESPSVLNIFVPESEWLILQGRLKLGKSVDRSTSGIGDQFISYRVGTLLISFIEVENT